MPLRTGRVEAAARTLLLLEELNRHKVASIGVLHTATRLPKATIVRLLKTLCEMGFVVNDRRQGGYTVASRVKLLSDGFRGDPLIIEAVRPLALAFTRKHHWPLAVAVLDGPSVTVRFNTNHDSPLAPFYSSLNMSLSLLGRAMGRAYLAFCPDSERSILLRMISRSSNPEDRCSSEVGDEEALLAKIRGQGFAERNPVIEPRSGTLAVPILAEGKVLATVGMTFYASALDRAQLLEHYAPQLQILAKNAAISARSLREARRDGDFRVAQADRG